MSPPSAIVQQREAIAAQAAEAFRQQQWKVLVERLHQGAALAKDYSGMEFDWSFALQDAVAYADQPSEKALSTLKRSFVRVVGGPEHLGEPTPLSRPWWDELGRLLAEWSGARWLVADSAVLGELELRCGDEDRDAEVAVGQSSALRQLTTELRLAAAGRCIQVAFVHGPNIDCSAGTCWAPVEDVARLCRPWVDSAVRAQEVLRLRQGDGTP